jgi:hypothetical protein
MAFGEATIAFDKESKENIINGVLNKSILIMPQLNKLNFGFARRKGTEYYYIKTISKLFFQDQQLEAEVTEIKIEGSDITLELTHAMLGEGKIKFGFSNELLRQTNAKEIQEILLNTLGDENHQFVYGDPQSKIYYSWSCNHLRNPSQLIRMTRQEAEEQGFREDAICFKKVVYLPQLMIEQAIERQWSMRLSEYEIVHNGSEKQTYLNSIGMKVLQNWPCELLGYQYSFHLANSRRADAFAIPTGKIIITTALFDSLAGEDELEALLVYAIAHIEQRHSLKKYYECLAEEEQTDTMKKIAAFAGALAGPAGGGISGALGLALPNASCNPQSLVDYDYDYVYEADSMSALYFDIQRKDRHAVTSLIKKLQFSELTEKLHPDLGSDDADDIHNNDRTKRVEETQFLYFGKEHSFVLERAGEPPVQMNLVFQRIFENKNTLRIFLDNKALIQDDGTVNGQKAISLAIKDKNEEHRFTLNDNHSIEDVWGIHLTFKASNAKKPKFLQDIKKVLLTMGPARTPNDRMNEQAGEEFTFLPGKIDL